MAKEQKKTKLADVKEVIDSLEIEELPEVREWCPTGSTLLDLAIADRVPGGIPIGRIVQVYGASSTCKSVIGSTILGYALRGGKKAFLADVENAFDPTFAAKFGLDSTHKDFHIGNPSTLEEFFDRWIAGIITTYKDEPKVLVVDSITALPSVFETETEMTEQGFGATRPKIMSLGLRKYKKALCNTNTTLFCIDQTRDNISGYGPKETTTGGRGMEFYASTRIYLKHEADIENSAGINQGIWVGFTIKKNRVAPPKQEGFIKLLYHYGIDDIASNLRFLAEYRGECTDDMGWKEAKDGRSMIAKVTLTFPDGDKEVLETTNVKTWIERIEERGLEKDLIRNVVDVWRDLHKTEDRKARVW
jgi:protein RecA